MASHGITRNTTEVVRSPEALKKEQKQIEQYRQLVSTVEQKIEENGLSTASLTLTSKLLSQNPEYYTIWNHRKRIIESLLAQFIIKENHSSEADVSYNAIRVLINEDLIFLLPLLRKYPKCYWIWQYRLWLLGASIKSLPRSQARPIWIGELQLANKMLSIDSRNFHGWGYRRMLVAELESPALSDTESDSTTMTKDEFDYTTKMINSNLSNFSAWHTRSKLIPKLLNERNASDAERKSFLDQELKLIERALWAGDQDQSLWFYHQCLVCNFDPAYKSQAITPNLTVEERTFYLNEQIERVSTMLEDDDGSKYIYQALLDITLLKIKLSDAQCNPEIQKRLRGYLDRLESLDKMRQGRWKDLRRTIDNLI